MEGVVCLDLPLRVQNPQKAVELVGGSEEIARVSANANFAKDPEPLQLRLREDPFHHPVSSSVQMSSNIIAEVELPEDCADVRAGLAKYASAVTRAKFRVDTLYRFRSIADFQYYCGNSAFLRRAEETIFEGNLDELDRLSVQEQFEDMLPPPLFSTLTQPVYYGYKQSPYLKLVEDDEGQQQLVYTVGKVKIHSNMISWGDEVPEGPPEGLEESPRRPIQQCIDALRELFAVRPSYTRRWLMYYLGPKVSRYLKYALPYVSYFYRSGPWRDSYIKYGHDPSKQPELAVYQVEHFRITAEGETKKDGEPKDGEPKDEDDEDEEGSTTAVLQSEYLFDGTVFPEVPKLQLKDIKDGFLENIIATQDLRTEVHPTDGWFPDRTITVIRRVLRQELVVLKEALPPLTFAEKQRIADEVQAEMGQLKKQ